MTILTDMVVSRLTMSTKGEMRLLELLQNVATDGKVVDLLGLHVARLYAG
jgi:hypothetical protein